MSEIYLAGGCFWGVEEFFLRINGVRETSVGYANSDIKNPSYELVCSGATNAVECVKINYDSSEIGLSDLLEKFFSIIDPCAINRQGNDFGTQYRSGIYFVNDADSNIILEFIAKLERTRKIKVATEILRLKNYYLAESYHQKYLKKNPNGYCHIDLNGV